MIVVGSVRFWMTPPISSTTAATTAIGRSTRTTARTRSTQKLPIVVPDERARPRTSAIGHGETDGGGDEVLDGQPHGLHEGRHAGLTGIRLPVGVGDEGDGRVDGGVDVHRGAAGQGERALERRSARRAARCRRPRSRGRRRHTSSSAARRRGRRGTGGRRGARRASGSVSVKTRASHDPRGTWTTARAATRTAIVSSPLAVSPIRSGRRAAARRRGSQQGDAGQRRAGS